MVAPVVTAAVEVAELVAAVDPRPGGPMAALLLQAAPALGDEATAVTERLGRLVAAGGADVRIVFGGHFSCGKSTLLNALLGRPLLPTGDYPETGVPCVVRSGERDEIVALGADGRRALTFGTEAIANEVSLIGDDGGYRSRVHAVDRIVVSLRGPVPPDGALWIDSPGINDTPAMDERARATASDGDVLVWVVNSRQPLSEVEQAFLHRHVADRDTAGVVFVVNVFLPDDSEAAWSRFLDGRAGYFRERIAEAEIVTDGPAVHFVSARAAAAHPDGFGGPEAAALLAQLSDTRHPHEVTRRCRHTVRRLDELADDLRDRLAAETARLAAIHTRRVAVEGRLAKQQPWFEQRVGAALAAAFARSDTVIGQRAAAIVAAIHAQPLRRDESYGARLTSDLVEVGRTLHGEIVDQVDRIAWDVGRGRLTAEASARIHDLLQPATWAIEIPDTAGARARRVLGRRDGGDGVARDRAGAAANATATARAAARELRAVQPEVLGIAVDPGSTPPRLPALPDHKPLAALHDLVGRLDTAADALRRIAA